MTLTSSLSIVWNNHARITKDSAIAHIHDWATCLDTPVTVESEYTLSAPTSAPSSGENTDTPDELAIRDLLLGIVHRTTGDYATSRALLTAATARQSAIKVSTWVGGVAWFELAVLDLKEQERRAAQAEEGGPARATEGWARVMKGALEKLEKALGLATQQVDLSSRLDSRIAMLKDEIALKREMLGIVA